MKSMNRVFLMGNMAANPELHESKNGKRYARLRLATDRYHTDANGSQQASTDYHSVFVWGRLAEICAEGLMKGAMVFVEGYLTYWKSTENKLYKHAIHASEVHFLRPRPLNSVNDGVDLDALEAAENLDNPQAPRNHNAVAHPA